LSLLVGVAQYAGKMTVFSYIVSGEWKRQGLQTFRGCGATLGCEWVKYPCASVVKGYCATRLVKAGKAEKYTRFPESYCATTYWIAVRTFSSKSSLSACPPLESYCAGFWLGMRCWNTLSACPPLGELLRLRALKPFTSFSFIGSFGRSTMNVFKAVPSRLCRPCSTCQINCL
jgi:hypothetical protein